MTLIRGSYEWKSALVASSIELIDTMTSISHGDEQWQRDPRQKNGRFNQHFHYPPYHCHGFCCVLSGLRYVLGGYIFVISP
jgi:hypothetical protein